MELLLKQHEAYESWVVKNPNLVRDLESTLKWSSFLVARITDSNIISELAYAISNLMVFYHDGIITAVPNPVKTCENKVSRIKVLLTIIDHSEVFAELIFSRLGGKRAKWTSITMIQFIKMVCRLYLLRNTKDKIVSFPPKTFFQRTIKTTRSMDFNNVQHSTFLDGNSFPCYLNRSGRIMRKIEGAPPLEYRSIYIARSKSDKSQSDIQKKFVFGELLYITKPLIHLIAIYIAYSIHAKWNSYVLALIMDISSLITIYQNRAELTKAQHMELSRRCVRLLLYLLRSPFYEKCTHNRIDLILNTMNNVPMIRLLSDAIRDYLPYWQQTYFYLWSF